MRRVAVIALVAGSVSCADRGERGLEYRWSTQPAWATTPPSRPPGDEEFVVRMHVPLLGPRPAIRLYQPPSLVAADVDGRPLDLRDHWAVKRLPTSDAELTLRYHTRYAVPQPVVAFGSEDTLAAQSVRGDLAPFGIAVAMLLLGAGALASLLIRRSRAWLFFGTFAISAGTMILLEVQDFYALLAIASVRDPLHEAAMFGVGASFAAFIAEVFSSRLSRALRALAISDALFGLAAVGLHVAGVVAARRLRPIAEAHVAAALVLSLAAAILARTRGSRVFLVGLALLVVTSIPDMLTGLGLLDVNVVQWGIASFVLCMGYVLYGHYGTKELELERRVRDVEALNAELRHQVAERSRELSRRVPDASTPELPKLGAIVAGRYEVLREIGCGGMGHVFEVVRALDGGRFALKVMSGRSGPDAVRFAREAEIAAKLSHPNLVSVVDVGIAPSGQPFIVMELVVGGTLAERTLERDQVRDVLAKIARGLSALHRGRIIHRDLKPSNVLVRAVADDDFEVKLADFGIARTMVSPYDATRDVAENVTKAGAFLGTPLYMAPEQALGADRVGPAADMFSFGVMAYELWAGRLPFATPLVFAQLAGARLPEPPTFAPFVRDERLRELLQSCLSQEPSNRPTADDLVAALE